MHFRPLAPLLLLPTLAGPLALAGPLTLADPAAATTHAGRFRPGPARVAAGTQDSLNWSGYAVRATSVTGVAGQWRVPSVASPVPPGFSATWVGVGGFTSSDLVQLGTEQDSAPLVGGGYFAWYELLPGAQVQIPGLAVHAGDTVRASAVQVRTGGWRLTMTDVGHWSWAKTVSYSSSRSSAEWILEAPQVSPLGLLGVQTALANVGTVPFTGATFQLAGHRGALSLAAGHPTAIELSLLPNLVTEATPSAYVSTSFAVCAYQSACARPVAPAGSTSQPSGPTLTLRHVAAAQFAVGPVSTAPSGPVLAPALPAVRAALPPAAASAARAQPATSTRVEAERVLPVLPVLPALPSAPAATAVLPGTSASGIGPGWAALAAVAAALAVGMGAAVGYVGLRR